MLSTQLQSVSVHHTELCTICKIIVLKECINFTSKYLYLIKVLHERSLQVTTTKSMLSTQLPSVSVHHTEIHTICKITVLKECINFTSKYLYLIKVLHERSLQLTTTKSMLSTQLPTVSAHHTEICTIRKIAVLKEFINFTCKYK